jgi:hypothetical protein
MRCEDVQLELARDAVDPAVRQAVASHVLECPACRSVQLTYDGIDETLRHAPMWEPRRGFAQMVAARTSEETLSEHSPDRLPVESLLQAATLSLLIGTAGYVGARFLDLLAPILAALTAPTPSVMWMWVAFSYAVAAWFARPARA